jgi:integrase/recombinase XerD
MTKLRSSLQDYLTMRRGLGFKLYDAGIGLLDFVGFMERKRASRITQNLLLSGPRNRKPRYPQNGRGG